MTSPPPGPPAHGASGSPPAPSRDRPRAPPAEAPTLAFLIACLGGWLIVVEGMLLLGGGGTAFQVGLVLPPSETVQLGGVGVTVGLGIVAVGFFLHETQGARKGIGVVTLALGAVSLVSGGGFLIGTVLTVAGGLIVILGKPTPLFHPGHAARK